LQKLLEMKTNASSYYCANLKKTFLSSLINL